MQLAQLGSAVQRQLPVLVLYRVLLTVPEQATHWLTPLLYVTWLHPDTFVHPLSIGVPSEQLVHSPVLLQLVHPGITLAHVTVHTLGLVHVMHPMIVTLHR